MNKNYHIILSALLFTAHLHAQFPGPVGTPGSTAIYKDSPIFIAWATACSVVRGYQNIADPTLGFTSHGDSSQATGIADGTGVVSLGDGGYAILTFAKPITNGPGFDFAVFENAFNDQFLELAFVEVSSDGINFFRFPATSHTPTSSQVGPFSNTGDATKLNNLAGKYRVLYGTPFDLQELDTVVGLNINFITHVKIIDVVGSIDPQYATYDHWGNAINDPFPTAFATGGFDLDAVGVIHELSTVSLDDIDRHEPKLYPNPAPSLQDVNFALFPYGARIHISDINGREICHFRRDEKGDCVIESGTYLVTIQTETDRKLYKLLIY
ncbi:MAG: T9SS type A sorting domain-containing protein [Chitinophagales bacterium]|nr:T9SS type A sorting domain-containing protein [Chitinophagales bacterium]MDW8418721.1 T9SS type A sorting domain-containing protein [Chitinophagales bacterium]